MWLSLRLVRGRRGCGLVERVAGGLLMMMMR